jgi:hypothetical protein
MFFLCIIRRSKNNQHMHWVVPLLYSTCRLLHVSAVVYHHQAASWIHLIYLKCRRWKRSIFFPRNVSNWSPIYLVEHPRGAKISLTQMQRTEITHVCSSGHNSIVTSRNSQHMHCIVPLLYSIYRLLHVSAVVCHHQGASWIHLSYLKCRSNRLYI